MIGAQGTWGPYKGLTPYQEQDAPYFFGRVRDTRVIVSNLVASRLTLIYGASGVGKSSVLHAGVIHHFAERAREDIKIRDTPKYIAVIFSSWRDDPILELQNHIRSAIENMSGDQATTLPEPTESFTETLRAWTKAFNTGLLIILDQFEDYFFYHGQEGDEAHFAVEFPRAVNDPDLPVNFLVSIREDALAKLGRFKRNIPNLLGNFLEIRHLGREAAMEAIERPIEKYNTLQPANRGPNYIEPALVETVVDQVRTGRVQLSHAAVDTASTQSSEHQIETPFLQLVMTRLWAEEIEAGSHTLRCETLNHLGGAIEIVRTHLDTIMKTLPSDERQVLTRLFPRLVTPGGNTLVLSLSDMASYADWPEERLRSLLDKASSSTMRIFRPLPPAPQQPDVPRYEIFHDVLGSVIVGYVEKEREKAIFERLRRQWFQRATVVLFGVFVLAVVVTIIAILQIQVAQDKLHVANVQRTQLDITKEALEVRVGDVAYLATFINDQSNLYLTQVARLSPVPTPTVTLEATDLSATQTQNAVLNAWEPMVDEVYLIEYGVEMVLVPAGCFQMGSVSLPDEQPVNEVCFAEPFWIDRYEVTNGQFAAPSGQAAEASCESLDAEHPRECISWFEARAFCEQRNARLPTEAEWEYAARGPESLVYPWGNEFVVENGVYAGNTNTTAVVGSRPSGASWVGAYDLSGNVQEWTSTIYDQRQFPYPYNPNDGREKVNNDSHRVVRGGSWSDSASFVRVAYRNFIFPTLWDNGLGFRCARNDQ